MYRQIWSFAYLVIRDIKLVSHYSTKDAFSRAAVDHPQEGSERSKSNSPPTVLQLPHYRDRVLLGTDCRYADTESLMT